jgi:MFS family permease
VVPLLGLAVIINYIDRGALGVAAPLLKDEFHLSATALGLITSAFFLSYAPGQVFAGWLCERIGPYVTLTLGAVIWSAATALSGLAPSFAALLGLRVILGVGESAAFPASSSIIAAHLPAHRKGFANGLVMSGTALGPAAGAFAGGLMMAAWGWRLAFVVFGLLSLLWLAPWALAARGQARREVPQHAGRSPSVMDVVRRPELWGAIAGHLAFNFTFYFFIIWAPLFLVKDRGFSMSRMAVVGAQIYLTYAVSLLALGAMSDGLIARVGRAGLIYKLMLVIGFGVVAASFGLAAVGHGPMGIAGLFGAAIGFGALTPSNYSLGQTLAGPRAGGVWMGLQNGIGNVGGIIGPVVVGMILDSAAGWDGAFAAASAIAVTGAASWILLVGKVEPIDWQ